MAVLELRDVSYTYPDAGRPAVEGISLRIETGEHIALLGSNGSGKTTLARIVAGLLTPDSGEVVLSGNTGSSAWNGVGLLFQNPDEQLLSGDVESELAWGLENLGVPPGEMKARVQKTLGDFDLLSLAKQTPDSLSDGWKQITALAALVIMQPDFLVLDEATAFLDPYWTDRIAEMTGILTENSGLLWISTNAVEGVRADRVILLSDGHLVDEGSPDEMLRRERLEELGITPYDLTVVGDRNVPAPHT